MQHTLTHGNNTTQKTFSEQNLKCFLKSLAHITLSVLLTVFMTVFTQNQAQANDEMIDNVINRGVLRVGFSSFVPWAMQNKEGDYIGFEIDVARRLANDLGVELQLVPTNWDGIIPALLAGKFDIIIGGMGATPQRSLTVNFSIPYDHIVMQIVTHKESGAHIKTFEDLNSSNAIIALRTGSTAAYLVKTQLPNAKTLFYNDEAPAVQEVVTGRAHAFISAKPLPSLMIAQNPDTLTQPFEITSYSEPICFAVRKGDFNTLNVLNSWIRQVEGLGWLKERSDYWFSDTQWQVEVK